MCARNECAQCINVDGDWDRHHTNTHTQIRLKIANNNIIVAKSTSIYSNFSGCPHAATCVRGQWYNIVGRFRIISNYCYVHFVETNAGVIAGHWHKYPQYKSNKCACVCFLCKEKGHHRHWTHRIFTHWIWSTCLQSNLTTSFIALLYELFNVRVFFVWVCWCVDHRWHYMALLLFLTFIFFCFFSPQARATFLIGMLFMNAHSKMRIHQNVILTTIHIFSWKTFQTIADCDAMLCTHFQIKLNIRITYAYYSKCWLLFRFHCNNHIYLRIQLNVSDFRSTHIKHCTKAPFKSEKLLSLYCSLCVSFGCRRV